MAEKKDVAASVRAQLTAHARQQKRPFQEVLQYFAIERFLYRLAQSPFRGQFVLKGGVGFLAWGVPLRRPTRDIDFLGTIRGTVEGIEAAVRQICRQPIEADGVQYDTDSVKGEITQPHAVYPGIRVRFAVSFALVCRNQAAAVAGLRPQNLLGSRTSTELQCRH